MTGGGDGVDPLARTVRVFVSSTFVDMGAERDHLVTVVFPELRERLAWLDLELYDVDLRWGVPTTGVDRERTSSWAYCKRSIDRTLPFFVALMGDRYGWVPLPGEVNETDRLLRGCSITEMEIGYALATREARSRRCFFYVRNPTESPAPDDPNFAQYVELDPGRAGRLERLKAEVVDLGCPVFTYPCSWSRRSGRYEGLEEFGCHVLEDLWSGVLRDFRYGLLPAWRAVLGRDPRGDPEYTDQTRPVSAQRWRQLIDRAPASSPTRPSDVESQQMEAFGRSRRRWFEGRSGEVSSLLRFVTDDHSQASNSMLVVSEPGVGKSALLAQLSRRLAERHEVQFVHFVGATTGSTSATGLNGRLDAFLDRVGVPRKGGRGTLADTIASRLEYPGEGPRIALLIDAIDQIVGGRELVWLPARLDPRMRVVLTCSSVSSETGTIPPVLAAIRARRPQVSELRLTPLSRSDVATVVTNYLDDYSKELTKEQVGLIADLELARNPLYLRVLLDQLRGQVGADLLTRVPQQLATVEANYPDTVSLFEWVLHDLEGLGREAVRRWLVYLAISPIGMTSDELVRLLEKELGEGGGPSALRVERSVRHYLQRRDDFLDFFHGQLAVAVLRRYVGANEASVFHGDIAAILWDQWRTDHSALHPLAALPHHLIEAGAWDRLLSLLDRPEFVAMKALKVGGPNVIDDFAVAFERLRPLDPDRASQIVDSLTSIVLRDDATERSSRVDLESVNAWLSYTEGQVLLQRLLEQICDRGAPGEVSPNLVLLARAYLIGRARRAGDLDRALEIANEIPESVKGTRALKAGAIAAYEAGYVHHLLGAAQEALRLLKRSEDQAAQAGDPVGAAISACVLAMIGYWSGYRTAEDVEEVLDRGRTVFENAEERDARADRWLVYNVEAHRFELAFDRGDVEAAARCLTALRGSVLPSEQRLPELPPGFEARLAMMEHRWSDAVSSFGYLSLSEPTGAETTEARARDYLHFGMALAGSGDDMSARTAWRLGLRCSDRQANGPWKRRIRHLLGDG